MTGTEIRNAKHHVMKVVTKRRTKCASCGNRLSKRLGRPSRYCSAACRQKAYRKRAANPHRTILRAVENDITKVQARDRAVETLRCLGFDVQLVPRVKPPRKQPQLRVVSTTGAA